jgi:hypothetical protein
MTLLGVIVPHERPVGTLSVSVTLPAKWLSEVRLIVEVADWVASTAAGEVAVIVKFWNMNRAVAVWTSGLLVPVIVRV